MCTCDTICLGPIQGLPLGRNIITVDPYPEHIQMIVTPINRLERCAITMHYAIPLQKQLRFYLYLDNVLILAIASRCFKQRHFQGASQ